MILPVQQRSLGDDDQTYQGADVLDAKVGFYNIPITTLDFASLYPSIMICHNLCYSTLTDQQTVWHLKEGEDYIRTPNGYYFVQSKVWQGILPIILNNLLNARKTAKVQLAIYKKQLTDILESDGPKDQ